MPSTTTYSFWRRRSGCNSGYRLFLFHKPAVNPHSCLRSARDLQLRRQLQQRPKFSLHDGVLSRFQGTELIADMTALGRAGLPDDIGPMIASPLSEDNRRIDAQRIEVSGGTSI